MMTPQKATQNKVKDIGGQMIVVKVEAGLRARSFPKKKRKHSGEQTKGGDLGKFAMN
jgi:hypothetical protein